MTYNAKCFVESNIVALEMLRVEIDAIDVAIIPSTEKMSFITRVLDVAIRVFNNIKTSALKSHLLFKRSELRAFHDSHVTALKKLFATQQLDYTRQTAIPSGMKVTYREAVECMVDCIDILNIDDSIQQVSTYLDALISSKTVSDLTALTKKTTTTINRLSRKDLERKLRIVFSSDKTGTVPLSKVIASFEDLRYVDEELLKLESFFSGVLANFDYISRIESMVDKSVTALENGDTVDTAFVSAFHDLILVCAEQLDVYGVILAELQRIEHNFVFVMNDAINNDIS